MLHFHRYKWSEPTMMKFKEPLNGHRTSVQWGLAPLMYRHFTREVQYGTCPCGKVKRRFVQ